MIFQSLQSLNSRNALTLSLAGFVLAQAFLLDEVAAAGASQHSEFPSFHVRKPLRNRAVHTSSHNSLTSDVGQLHASLMPRSPSPNPFKVFLNKESDTLPPLKCDHKPINPDSWWAASIDRYLGQYPRGNKLSLADFARENGASNFNCRAGELCNAGMFCAPITGRAWYVLLAAQQYNAFQKSLIDAVGFAASSAVAIGAQMVQDLTDQKAYRQFLKLHRFAMVLTILGAVSAMACAFAFVAMPALAGFAFSSSFAAVTAIAQTSTIYASENAAKKAGEQDPFTQWAPLAAQISNWQERTQTGLAEMLDKRVLAGVSTEAGMFGVLKRGPYFYNILPLSTNDMEKKYKKIIVARLLNHVLKDKQAFVTIGSDPCTHTGKNGAFPLSEGWLSYCDKNKLMRNVVFADGNRTGNKWYNAHLIPEFYGISVEYITTQSERCFKYYGFDGEPYGKTQELPQDINSDCIMNLPVCDTRGVQFQDWLDEDNTTVVTCRVLQKLPV